MKVTDMTAYTIADDDGCEVWVASYIRHMGWPDPPQNVLSCDGKPIVEWLRRVRLEKDAPVHQWEAWTRAQGSIDWQIVVASLYGVLAGLLFAAMAWWLQ